MPTSTPTPPNRVPLPPAGRFIPVRGWRMLARIVWMAAFAFVLAAIPYTYLTLPAAPFRSAVTTVIQIPAGGSSAEIAKILSEEGLIRSEWAFVAFSKLLGADDQLQAGFYRLSSAMRLPEILTQLEHGAVATVRVTIPEGFRSEQIADLLAANGLIDRERFMELAQDDEIVFDGWFPVEKPLASLEGYLYPDTYVFPYGTSEEDIIKRLVAQFVEKALPIIRERLATSGFRSVHDVVTLASVIEKEALYDRERPLVSAVFHNRLDLGMPLQSNPTVEYALRRFGAALSLRDIEVDSPYNTYRYGGLPIGPIANPGMASIRSVLEPADVDYLYFLGRGDGTHFFSRTFSEHVAARRRYGL